MLGEHMPGMKIGHAYVVEEIDWRGVKDDQPWIKVRISGTLKVFDAAHFTLYMKRDKNHIHPMSANALTAASHRLLAAAARATENDNVRFLEEIETALKLIHDAKATTR